MTQTIPSPELPVPLPPPAELVEAKSSVWMKLQETHPLISYLNNNLIGNLVSPEGWQGARYSSSVYLYKETSSEFKVIVKFFEPKTGADAIRHAEGELEKINQVRSAGMDAGHLRAIKALGAIRGVLFLEYVAGLTLADVIAVRRSQPGLLGASLNAAAHLLAKLHSLRIEVENSSLQEKPIKEALKYTAELGKYGVIKDEPAIAAAIRRLISIWRSKPEMIQFTPTLCHGDATTTNFIFPNQGQVIAIDWERLKVSDPAADIGRLLAEINHTLDQHGESGLEIAALEDIILNTYIDRVALDSKLDEFKQRVHFHQASSTLRIARNGWISRSDRMALVTRAMALLSA